MELINNQRLAQIANANYNDEIIKPGRFIYSRTHTIVKQFRQLSRLGKCVLITSFSDACVTKDMAEALPSNVKRWYSNNVMCDDPRVISVPIGCTYNIEREKVLLKMIEEKNNIEKKNMLYINFTIKIPRDPNPRLGLYESFNRPWVTQKGGTSFTSISSEEFYRDIIQHYYVLSPHGAGPDCHRHWETLLLGGIPIVQVCKANEILDDMPCLRVNAWHHVTLDVLVRTMPVLMERYCHKSIEKLYFDYWKERILNEFMC